jgi:AraC-like DNA-binding protein
MAAEQSRPLMARSHMHPEVELNLVLDGTAAYATPWGLVELPRRRLTAFWGGFPHRLLARDVDLLVVTVPLSAMVGRAALDGALAMVVQGYWLLGTDEEAGHDEFLLRRWIADLARGAADPAARACEAELHARLARLGVGVEAKDAARLWGASAADRLLAGVARSYTQAASVAEHAADAGVHPTYAAKIFKDAFGMPLWEYVTHLRVAHAVSLLTGSDWCVDRIAFESGFTSRSSFYRAFGRLTGRSPALLRRSAGPAAVG